MPGTKSQFNALIKQLASTEIHTNVKSFIIDLYNQFSAVQADYFKAEHRDEFLRLRTECRDLINQTRGFCDKAIPSLEYAIKQYSSPNPVDVKILAETVLSRVNSKDIIEQCEKVENTIMTFNDRIATDEYYKKTNIKSFLSFVFGTTLAITSLIGFFFAPVVLEVEIALAASGFIFTNVLSPSIDLFSSGLNRIRAVENFKQCKENMIEASKFVNQLKKELSDVTQNHSRLEVRLDMQDVHDLKPIYERLLENMNDIRQLCLKPFPAP
ncbi:unnamed protein product [Rotaria sordida]|uniref:Uncharacterized protein n=1 Tax=Rotaria sordida TaxID=392033 RepID=A0A819WVK1_9BILA|nr:unnamed protein product [Rotaria sordida]CAF1266784.1 unnamed protein product [Rotaria sordida]CAF4079951.1 unnamed protein product [Rotaria sordida]CAF4114579.1 unnamed protein product [Rotaria sordida]CAF4127251.1 unnamed protein product [Rotaria sordida]